jgi:uncharacterized membrane protein HdeD (DUF308 family)
VPGLPARPAASQEEGGMVDDTQRSWWLVAVRGVAAPLIGLLALI